MEYTSESLRALIRKTLQSGLTGIWSASAEELLMATCAQESLLGKYRKQISGPALGIFQMEPFTHDDCWSNFIVYRPDLMKWLETLSVTHEAEDLINNDPYSISMARVKYERAKVALPKATDLQGLWQYYHKFYNSAKGAATEQEFYTHYKNLVTDGIASL